MIPIRTSYRLHSTPWVNYALVAANVVLFVLGYNGMTLENMARIDGWLLEPHMPRLSQFFSSIFLHAHWGHLLGNMVFLWVFGNAINDRFGHLGYLAFYLAGGVLAGIGYLALSGEAPVLGASGAISAVTGAYLVLFPRTRVTLLFWFYIITFFELPSLYFLLFQFVLNLWMSLDAHLTGPAAGGVAYAAHSSGYLFGIATAAVLLALRVLPRDAFDLLNLIRSARRRQRYQRMVARGYDPFNYLGGAGRRDPRRAAPSRRVDARTVHTVTPDTPSARELELRRSVAEACARNDMPAAAQGYLKLVQIADDAVLSRQNQLDVANQLMAAEQYPAAADAYERFLTHYANYEHTGDIHLMLGLLYGRYLQQYDRAEQALERALGLLHDPRKVALARTELEGVRRRK